MEWIQSNLPELIILVLAVISFILYIVYLCKRDGLRVIALRAILEAEKHYNSTTGKERLSFAVDYVYEYIPGYIKVVLPKSILKDFLQQFIQKVFDQVKDLLDYEKGADLIEEVKE